MPKKATPRKASPHDHAVEVFIADLREYLRARRETDGGWAKILPGDVDELREIIQKIIELKCEADLSGGSRYPIQFVVNNRKKNDPFSYRPVPSVSFEGQSDRAYDEAIDVAMYNLGIAYQGLDLLSRLRYEFRRERPTRKEARRA